jgi:hypothetical protein
MAFFKSVFIKIKDGTKDNAIGNRWKDHTTMLVLSPDVPPTTGLWRTDPIDRDDIDSCGGNRGAQYVWNRKDKALYVQCPDHDTYRTALLVLNGVGEIFERDQSGEGRFPFQGEQRRVTWQIVDLRDAGEPGEESPSKTDYYNAEQARLQLQLVEDRMKEQAKGSAQLGLNQATAYARIIENEKLKKKVWDEVALSATRNGLKMPKD